MVSHVVVMKPRLDLSSGERQSLVAAFSRAVREIPSVRQVRVGRRIAHGAVDEERTPGSEDYLIVLDFDDVAALRRYLSHPAHEELARRFNQSLSSALIYDFEVWGGDELDMFLKEVIGD